jgi:hypothetical protein
MAKNSMSTKFVKATITEEEIDGKKQLIITEYLKDETKTYNLTEELVKFMGVEGIALTISTDSELKPIE